MTEREFKLLFKKSVLSIGGFASSIVGNINGGFPDLYCILPIYGPVLIEAKFFKDVGDKFNRKINYSALQNVFMDNANKVRGGSVLGLVGMKYKGELIAYLVPGYVKQLNSDDVKSYRTFVYNPKTKLFDMSDFSKNFIRGSDAVLHR